LESADRLGEITALDTSAKFDIMNFWGGYMGLASCLGLRGWLDEPVLGGLLLDVVGGVPTLCQQCSDYFDAQISSIGVIGG
jgi:hypothetical protein